MSHEGRVRNFLRRIVGLLCNIVNENWIISCAKIWGRDKYDPIHDPYFKPKNGLLDTSNATKGSV